MIKLYSHISAVTNKSSEEFNNLNIISQQLKKFFYCSTVIVSWNLSTFCVFYICDYSNLIYRITLTYRNTLTRSIPNVLVRNPLDIDFIYNSRIIQIEPVQTRISNHTSHGEPGERKTTDDVWSCKTATNLTETGH